MPTGTGEATQENLCAVADSIRARLSEINDCLDRLECCPSGVEKNLEAGGLEALLNTCRSEADRAKNRLDSAVRRIGHL